MSGKNWSTTSSVSSGGSTILSPASSRSSFSSVNLPSNAYYSGNNIISDTPFNINNYRSNSYNDFINKMFQENRKYNEMLSNKEYSQNYKTLKNLYNMQYDRFLENRNYVTNLANTAVERQMEDMKRAGINPILAARYGGAVTPNVALPSWNLSTPLLNYDKSSMPYYENEQLKQLEILLEFLLGKSSQENQYYIAKLNNEAKASLQKDIAENNLNYLKQEYNLKRNLENYINNLNITNKQKTNLFARSLNLAEEIGSSLGNGLGSFFRSYDDVVTDMYYRLHGPGLG